MAGQPSIPISALVHNADGTIDALNAVKYVAGDGSTPLFPGQPTTDAAERVARLEAVVRHAESGPKGFEGVREILERGAENNLGAPGLRRGAVDRMREAFNGAVHDGSWTPADTKALVAAEVRHGMNANDVASMSGYLAHLDGPNADAARDGFARESFAAAQSLASKPEQSAMLYTQAAEALGKMSPEAMKRTLDAMRETDRNAISKLAYGAMGGTATLAQAASRGDSGRIDTAGIGSVMKSLADHHQQSELVDVVHGASQYLTEQRGSAAEHLLLSAESKTGLREAMNAASAYEPGGKSNFDAILRSNRDASGLSDSGMDLMANLSRAELGGSARDGASAGYGQNLGNALGHMAVDLAKSGASQDTALRSEFGAQAFGTGSPLEQERVAARTLGNFTGQIREGLNQDFDARSGQAASRQSQITSTLTTLSDYAKAAALIPTPQTAALKKFSDAMTVIKDEIPRDRTLSSDEAHALGEKLDGSMKELLSHRPDLQAEYKNGVSDSATYGRQADEAQKRHATNASAEKSGGFVGRAIRDVVAPQPQEPAALKPPTSSEMTAAVREAVVQHNESRTKRYDLREPANDAAVKPVSDVPRRGPVDGTLLKAEVNGKPMYFIHTGRGNYQELDPIKDLHGVEPSVRGADGQNHSLVGQPVHLAPNGIVTAEPQRHHAQQPQAATR